MNCFHHPDQSAVATCRNCGRCLCRPCCREWPKGIICSETCQTELERYVADVEKIHAETLKMYKGKNRSVAAGLALAYIWTFLGVFFVAWVMYLGAVIGRLLK